LREALELAGEPVARARVALALGRWLSSWAAFTEAARTFEDARDGLGDGARELARELEAQHMVASVTDPSLHTAVFEARLAELLEDRERVEDPVVLAVLAIASAARTPPASAAVDLATRALGDPRLSAEEDPAPVAMATIALQAADHLEAARDVWTRAEAAARARGSSFGVGFAWTMRAGISLRLGAVTAAEADARTAHDRQLPEWRVILPWILTSLVDALVERGELDEAGRLLERAGLTGVLPELFPMDQILSSVGRLRIAQGQTAEGIARLRECGRRLEGYGARNPALVPWRADLAIALAAAGEAEEARALAREEIALAQAFAVPREHGIALRAAGLVESGDAGIELLGEAVGVLEGTPARLEHARALIDLGAALRRANRRTDAREPLRAGLDLAQRCGASALARRGHEELVATGSRPRRLVLRGVEALTASERRIAELAAEGLGNREIAQALFVTEKTVEGHLSHVYAKLDIRSRSLLPAALERDAPLATSA